MTSYSKQLTEFGLTETESRLYLYLLEHGLTSPPQLARDTGVLRTNCYNVLLSLKAKGLVTEERRGARKAYLAQTPRTLLGRHDRKRVALEEIVPDLEALSGAKRNKPKIHFYDGLEEVKEIYWQVARAEEVFGVGSVKSLAALDPLFWKQFLRECKKHNVIFHDILTHESLDEAASLQATLGALYDFRVLLKEEVQPTDILVYGDNVALITLEEPVFGTALTSSLLAQTFRVMWRTMRKGLQ